MLVSFELPASVNGKHVSPVVALGSRELIARPAIEEPFHHCERVGVVAAKSHEDVAIPEDLGDSRFHAIDRRALVGRERLAVPRNDRHDGFRCFERWNAQSIQRWNGTGWP